MILSSVSFKYPLGERKFLFSVPLWVYIWRVVHDRTLTFLWNTNQNECWSIAIENWTIPPNQTLIDISMQISPNVTNIINSMMKHYHRLWQTLLIGIAAQLPKKTRIWKIAFNRYSLDPWLWPIHPQRNARREVFCVKFSLLEYENGEKFKGWNLKRILFKFRNESTFQYWNLKFTPFSYTKSASDTRKSGKTAFFPCSFSVLMGINRGYGLSRLNPFFFLLGYFLFNTLYARDWANRFLYRKIWVIPNLSKTSSFPEQSVPSR